MKNNSISCFLGLHEYYTLIDNDKYIVKQCKICKNYIVEYKMYNVKSKFKKEELPENIINKIKYKSQV